MRGSAKLDFFSNASFFLSKVLRSSRFLASFFPSKKKGRIEFGEVLMSEAEAKGRRFFRGFERFQKRFLGGAGDVLDLSQKRNVNAKNRSTETFLRFLAAFALIKDHTGRESKDNCTYMFVSLQRLKKPSLYFFCFICGVLRRKKQKQKTKKHANTNGECIFVEKDRHTCEETEGLKHREKGVYVYVR